MGAWIYRIDGGVPAGMFMSPLESGDRQKSVMIRSITRHGNNSTSASGSEREESPVSRIRRLKKFVEGAGFSTRRGLSSTFFSGLFWVEGSLRVTSGKSAITASLSQLLVWCPLPATAAAEY